MGKGVTKRLFKGDRTIWTVFFLLCALSLIEVFSATSRQTYASGNYWQPITKHALFLIAGVAVVWFIHNMKIEWIKKTTKIIYLTGVILLIYALIGGDRLNDSSRWVSIAGIRFQPLEIAKMGLVMATALILAKSQTPNGTDKDAMKKILSYAIIPCGLIFLENLSTVIIVGLTLYAMMFLGRVNSKHMIILTGSVLLVGIIAVTTIVNVPENFKHGNQFQRKVLTWKHRFVDVGDVNKQVHPKDYVIAGNEQRTYAKIAIASSGIIGLGPGNSVQRDFLPHAYSDFIYAIIIEELGLIGGIVVIFLYLTLLFKCGKIASRCEDPYPAFLIMGVGIIICMQAMLHMTISVGDFVTGQPLPLVSQGGTSILINCVYIGIMLSVSRYVRKLDKNKEKINSVTTENNTVQAEEQAI